MSTEPLSARTYATAVRMAEASPTMAKPRPENFAHLDAAPRPPAPEPDQPPAATASDTAVRDALARMQTEARIKFAEPSE